jgi:hypothetical protein
MPNRIAGPCNWPGCPRCATNRGYCAQHAKDYNRQDKQRRGSSAERGYDKHWMDLRAQYFRAAGIPKSNWHNYRLHHRPRYDPTIDPVHEHYTLTVMTESEHNSITDAEDHSASTNIHYANRQRDDEVVIG